MNDTPDRVPMPWVKLHTSLLDDPNFGQLPDEIRARYYDLLMLAGRCDAGGAFIYNGETMDTVKIAWHLRMYQARLQEILEVLQTAGFMILNGRGWQISKFEEEQGPDGFYGKKCAEWSGRQKKHRNKDKTITSDTDNNNGLVTRDNHVTPSVKSQSQIKSKSQEEESEDSQSVSPRPTDDISKSDQKSDLCNQTGIPGKYSRRIIANDQITTEDLLAELARNYSRMGKGKGQVKNPGVITGMNLSASPVEKPAVEWYDRSKWGSLPEQIKKNLGIVIQSQDDCLKNSVGVTTRNPMRGKAVTEKIEHLLGREP